jgi:hypothetical protein
MHSSTPVAPKNSPKGNWQKHTSGDKGVYTDYTLCIGAIRAVVEEWDCPHGGHPSGGRRYAYNKPPVSEWTAKIGTTIIPYQPNKWEYPTAQDAMRACEAYLLKICTDIQETLNPRT